MLAALVREIDLVNPEYTEARKAGRETRGISESIKGGPGKIINRPDAFKLVRNGMAVPADEECKKAAGMTEEGIQKAIQAMTMLEESVGFDYDNGKLVFEDSPEYIGEQPQSGDVKDDLLFIIKPIAESEKAKREAERAKKQGGGKSS